MTVDSPEDLAALKKIGQIVALTLQTMKENLRPGITTAELDEIGRAYLESHGARSAPTLVYNFPGATCISLNEEAAHGIPGDRVIQDGDLVNIDVSAELDGYFADMGATYPLPPVTPQVHKLLRCTRRALDKSIAVAQAGRMLNEIGRVVEEEAKKCGFNTLRNLTGHGVGRHIHEPPQSILNYYEPRDRRRLEDGMVITLEPFLSTGAAFAVEAEDGWTLKTADGSLTAQFEHTLVVTKGQPVIITQA